MRPCPLEPVLRVVLLIAAAAASWGCDTAPRSDPSTPNAGASSSVTACTDPATCCPAEELRCVGDPDSVVVCTCASIWDCDLNIEKCTAALPTPDGGGEWACRWSDEKYACRRSGSAEEQPPEGWGDWACRWASEVDEWQCWTEPPRPTGSAPLPEGAGGWLCEVEQEFGKIVCSRVPGEAPPAEAPPALAEEPASAPPPPPLAAAGDTCVAGERRWCAPTDECGWGQVECDAATGDWKTRMVEGEEVLDCQGALAAGRRPDTLCACFHYFFTEACCERDDCVVPSGTSGQICEPSSGLLCDYCDPVNPECVEPGGMCLMMKTKESFCVRGCAADPCPTGYSCIDVTTPEGTTKQCVPDDRSCYL